MNRDYKNIYMDPGENIYSGFNVSVDYDLLQVYKILPQLYLYGENEVIELIALNKISWQQADMWANVRETETNKLLCRYYKFLIDNP